ncbi:MAG: hypothetical protein WBX27_01920, partial [Specibacter sp.]
AAVVPGAVADLVVQLLRAAGKAARRSCTADVGERPEPTGAAPPMWASAPNPQELHRRWL